MSFPPLPSATQIQTALRHKSEIEHHRNKIRLRAKRRGHYEFPVVDDLSSGDTRERHRVYRRAQMQIDKILDPTASVPSVFIEPRKRCALRAGLPEVCLWRPCSPAPAWAAPITRLPLHLPQNLVPGFTLPPLIQLVENGSHPFFLRWSPLVSLLRLPSLPVPSPPRHGQVHFFSHSCPQSLGLLVFQTPVPKETCIFFNHCSHLCPALFNTCNGFGCLPCGTCVPVPGRALPLHSGCFPPSNSIDSVSPLDGPLIAPSPPPHIHLLPVSGPQDGGACTSYPLPTSLPFCRSYLLFKTQFWPHIASHDISSSH